MNGLKFSRGELPNQVTVLEGRIAEIQKNCRHQWQFVGEKIELPKTLQENVFSAGRGTNRYYEIKRQCSECNLAETVSAACFCFKCLSPLHQLGWAGSREKFYQEHYTEYGHFSIRQAICPNCGHIVIHDEWDR